MLGRWWVPVCEGERVVLVSMSGSAAAFESRGVGAALRGDVRRSVSNRSLAVSESVLDGDGARHSGGEVRGLTGSSSPLRRKDPIAELPLNDIPLSEAVSAKDTVSLRSESSDAEDSTRVIPEPMVRRIGGPVSGSGEVGSKLV